MSTNQGTPRGTAGGKRGGAAAPGDGFPVFATGTFDIRRGERATAWLFFLYFFVLACSHYAVKSVRQATFIDSLGADKLPWVYLLVALVSLPVLVLYSKLAERYRPQRLIIEFCLIHGLVLAAFCWMLGWPGRWAPVVFYVWATVAFGIAVSQLWSYASHIFDPRQARRLFAFVGAGGLLGGIPGGLIARAISARFGTRYTLIAAAIMVLSVALVVLLIEKVRPPARGILKTEELEPRIDQARGGMRAVLGSRLLELIALLMLLMVVTAQMVDLQFNWAIQQGTSGLDERTAVFGTFFAVMGLLGFGFQLLFTRRIHRALGVGFGMQVLPVTVTVTTVLLILAIGFFPAAIFAAAWGLKLGESGLRHSIDQATRELLFLPVPGPLRRRGKAFIDVFVQRFAKGAAAVVLLPVTFGVFGIKHVGLMTLVVISLWLWVASLARREYVKAFREGLKSSIGGDPATIDLGDVTTVTTLVESLGSSDAREVLHSVEILSTHGQGRLISPLLLHHSDAEVRRQTIRVLATEGRADAAPLIEKALGDDDPDVRSTAIGALATLRREDAAAMMRDRLGESDPRLRSAAVAFLLDLGEGEIKQLAATTLAEMLSDGDPTIRREAAKALGQLRGSTGHEALIQLFYDTDLGVVRQAVTAVRRRLAHGDRSPLYIPILISLMGNRRLKHDAREAIVAYGESALEALVLFMNSPDEHIWVRRAVPKTIALMGGEGAVDALVDTLSVPDAFLRAKLIAALAYLRRRNKDLEVHPRPVKRHIRSEAGRYARSLADLLAVTPARRLRLEGARAMIRGPRRQTTLLQLFLVHRMDTSVNNLFMLLELLLPSDDVRAAARSLLSGHSALHARALEYLDNTLGGALRRDVFVVIDDAPAEDKVQSAGHLFGVRVERAEDTVRRLIETDPTRDRDNRGLIVAALYWVWEEGADILLPSVEQLVESSADAFVQETARWVLTRVNGEGTAGAEDGRIVTHEPRAVRDRREGGVMAPMASIEMMVLLQSVDLFSYCDAEQVLRLAAIAREKDFGAGEVIYRRTDPADALYCVVEGRVELTGAGNSREEVGPKGRFGVLEILAGRLRSSDATAIDHTRVLVIEVDDFYDLLSNNIEIVKALFRQITLPVGGENGGLT